jgi:hypothetical protein
MWAFFAFTAALLQSGLRLTNQYFKLPGLKLVLTGKLIQLIIITPLTFFVVWPKEPLFYILTALTAPFVVFQDKSLYDFTARFGAGAVTRIEPLSVPILFISWLLINPDLLMKNLENPITFAGISLCILASAFFATQMRHSAINFQVIKAMLPIIIIMATLNIISKTGIDCAPDHNGIVIYIFIQAIFVILISLLLDHKQSGKFINPLEDKKLLKASFILSILLLNTMALRLYGYILASNPAYVTAVMLTTPFWILLFYKLTKHEEKGDIKPGIGIVISSILMTLLVVK